MQYLDKNGLSRLWSKVKALVNDSLTDIYPIGSGLDYYGLNLPSDKWMWANGQAISRTKYAELFNIIGTVYGASDGSTTFNLPDKRKRVSVMAGASGTLSQVGAIGGEESHTLTVNEMPSHSHTFTGLKHSHTNYIKIPKTDSTYGGITQSSSFYGGNILVDSTGTQKSKTYTVTSTETEVFGSNSNTGKGTSHNNLQPYLICNYMIKVK